MLRSHRELNVYKSAMELAVKIFQITKDFPADEKYSLVDQIRRSSRSVCANLAEAWRKRRYRAAFICKLSDAETEAGETQSWIEFAVKCDYADREQSAALYQSYDEILRMLVAMINNPDSWI